jgi:hypothetical protein
MARHGICFTFNNYTPETLIKARGAIGQAGIKYICWGIEVGEEGTPHMQGYIQSNQDMYKRLMKVIGTCHMEKQKGDSKQAVDYCKKDGDFVEFGTYEFIDSPKNRQGKRGDHDEIKEMIKKGATFDEIAEFNFGYIAKYHVIVKERIAAQRQKDGKSSLLAEYEGVSWKPWQQAVLDVLAETPNRRKIHWIWEPTGNVGKSWLAKYIMLTESAMLLESGKKADMAYIFVQNPSKVVMIDLSRTSAPVDGKDYLGAMYSLCENLKNGFVQSTKYQSTAGLYKVPHVIVFANWEPDYTKWSPDRYLVTRI